ncbi:peptide-binding protein [Chengkuizengella marina]|uniref:Peptide-binding protein n=1 Tax=Chengkuizengella marina TaxID=2507566 RepID=A0A6N9Q162_9BACL|nr:peptide-binding protein [Chengkuizengella marina]NBI28523.1 peptide-binding protein [Chengkuizengella marina]
MKLKKATWLLLSLTLVFSLFLSACGTESTTDESPETNEEQTNEEATNEEQASGDPQYGGTLIMGSIGAPTLFNPLYSTDTASSDIEGLIYSAPVSSDTSFEVEYDLASDIQTTEDGLTYTVTLRDDVKFHDGEQLTADDLVFTYSIPISEDYVGERASSFEMIDTITKIDEYTVEFKLKQKDATFLPTTLSYEILPEHILKDVPIGDLGEDDFNTKTPIGSGPFKFEEWKDGQYVKVVRNDDYFQGKPYLDAIIYKIVPDANALIAQLQAGDVDYFPGVPGSDIETVKEWAPEAGVKIESGLSLAYTYLGYNQKNELFQDKQVRQALTHAINREAIIDGVLNGDGEVANVPESPLSWAYNSDVPVFEYDVNKAKQLLEEAGWTDTDGDGILDKDGKKFTFEIKTNQGNKIREDIVVVLQQQLKEIGIEVTPNIMEWSAYIEAISAPNWDYDALVLGWALSTFPDQYDIFHSSQREEGLNFVWYSNPEADVLIEEAKQIIDRDKYKQAYGDIYKIIAEDQPYTFLYYPNTHQAMPENLEGYIFHARNDLYRTHEWWLKQE